MEGNEGGRIARKKRKIFKRRNERHRNKRRKRLEDEYKGRGKILGDNKKRNGNSKKMKKTKEIKDN